MRKAIYITICAIIVVLTMVSCSFSGNDNRKLSYDYTINCRVANDLHCDSATLFFVDDDYNKQFVVEGQKSKDGFFCFKGQIDHPCVAYIKFAGNDEKKLFLVIEPGTTNIDVTNGRLIVRGGAQTHDYMSYRIACYNLEKERRQLRRRYLKCVADSSLTQDIENDILNRDHQCADSLQQMTLRLINKHNQVSAIIKANFGNKLDSAHVAQIN